LGVEFTVCYTAFESKNWQDTKIANDSKSNQIGIHTENGSASLSDSNSTKNIVESGNPINSSSQHDLAAQLILLARRWRMILVSAISGTILAAGLALFLEFTHETIYKLNAYIVPPQTSDVQSLTTPLLLARQANLLAHLAIWSQSPRPAWTPNAPQIPIIDANSVYYKFEQVLISRDMQDRFSNEKHSPIRFVIRKESGNTITLILFTHDPEKARDWIRDYTNVVNQTVIKNLASDLRQLIDDRLMLVDQAKRSLERIHKQRVTDHIAQLEEALGIANALGISARIRQSPLSPAVVPLYYQGSTFLRAEIQATRESRTYEAFYWTIHLREIEEWSRKLRQISINTSDALAAKVQISSDAVPEKLKPGSIVIICFGFAIALSLGIFAALVSNNIRQTRP
jgi:LPS O-antigen subunit length determinant protein (WzzB/FepE family)